MTTFAATQTRETLDSYALALNFLGMAFYAPPAQEFLTILATNDLFDNWLLPEENAQTAQGLSLLRAALVSAPPAALVRPLRDDYNALFVGPDHLLAPPWESVYLSSDHLIFDEQTLAVRAAYSRFGLQIPRIDREPDDHIGFELLFLSHLAKLAAEALANDDPSQATQTFDAARAFLQAHPQQWVHLLVERIDQHARTDYYRGLAHLLLGSLASLNDFLLAPLPSREGPA